MAAMRSVAALLLAAHGSTATPTNLADVFEMPVQADPESCAYPTNCPGKVLPRADKQTVRREPLTPRVACALTPLRSAALTVDDEQEHDHHAVQQHGIHRPPEHQGMGRRGL